MNLILIARNAKVLNEMAQEMRDKHNIKVEVIQADFTQDVYDRIEQRLAGKNIGVLVNNVGLFYPEPMHFNDLELDFTKNLMTTNMTSMTNMLKIVLPIMEKQQKGAIVNISSILGMIPSPLFSVYSASKCFVINISRALAAEYKDKGITIQALCPGGVDTGMLSFMPEDKKGNLFVPPPDVFAASAIKTIGFSDYTCGYWAHSLLSCFFILSPQQHYKHNLKMLDEIKNNKK